MDIANLLSDPVAELKLNADRLLSSPAPPNFNNARRYESCIIPNVMKLYQSMRAIRLNPVVFRPPTILTCEIREGPYKSDASKFVHATSPPAGFVGISSFCPEGVASRDVEGVISSTASASTNKKRENDR